MNLILMVVILERMVVTRSQITIQTVEVHTIGNMITVWVTLSRLVPGLNMPRDADPQVVILTRLEVAHPLTVGHKVDITMLI